MILNTVLLCLPQPWLSMHAGNSTSNIHSTISHLHVLGTRRHTDNRVRNLKIYRSTRFQGHFPQPGWCIEMLNFPGETGRVNSFLTNATFKRARKEEMQCSPLHPQLVVSTEDLFVVCL
eukprot:scpid109084/ scgid17688/ 